MPASPRSRTTTRPTPPALREHRRPATDRPGADDDEICPISHGRHPPCVAARIGARRACVICLGRRAGRGRADGLAGRRSAARLHADGDRPRDARSRSNVERRRTVQAATSSPAARASAIEVAVERVPLDRHAAAAERRAPASTVASSRIRVLSQRGQVGARRPDAASAARSNEETTALCSSGPGRRRGPRPTTGPGSTLSSTSRNGAATGDPEDVLEGRHAEIEQRRRRTARRRARAGPGPVASVGS